MIGRGGGKKSINRSVIAPGRLQNFVRSSKINEYNTVEGDPLRRIGPMMIKSTLIKRVQQKQKQELKKCQRKQQEELKEYKAQIQKVMEDFKREMLKELANRGV